MQGERRADTHVRWGRAHAVGARTEPASAGDTCDAADFAPTTADKRTFDTVDFATFWITLVISITTYYLAASLVDLGMSWWQGILTVFAGNIITLVPMVLNAHPGTKFGVPFPVLARSSFGILVCKAEVCKRGRRAWEETPTSLAPALRTCGLHACRAPTCPPSLARSSPAGGLASRPGWAATASTRCAQAGGQGTLYLCGRAQSAPCRHDTPPPALAFVVQMLVAITKGAVVMAPVAWLGISPVELACFSVFWAAQVCTASTWGAHECTCA